MAVISNNVISFDYNLETTTIKKLSKIYCNVGIIFVTQPSNLTKSPLPWLKNGN